MIVYKFGGASVKDEWGVKNLAKIVGEAEGNIIVVVSALGKTTNALENLCLSISHEDGRDGLLLDQIKGYHYGIASALFSPAGVAGLLDESFRRLSSSLKELKGMSYDYVYDYVVSEGEIWSTMIVSEWLNKSGVAARWLDIRDYLITDARHRDANVDWETSRARFNNLQGEDNKVVVTQGFIGATADGKATTLGREGSDYTAAIIANICNADSVTIWKDVPGVLNADPRWLDHTEELREISYKEAVEMSFSGAKIIHPKTIKPLHNKCIPLYVKSFLKPGHPGTIISVNETLEISSPVFVRKQNQLLISFIPKDFSFVIGDNLGSLFALFYEYGVKTNLVQASAVSIAVCVDDDQDKISTLSEHLAGDYKILINKGVEMLTLRNYTPGSINKITSGREILIEQRTRKSIRYVVK